MDRRRCRAWKSVIVGCFTYLKGLETASLVPSKISLTKAFASFARDRSMYFVVLVKENKNYLAGLNIYKGKVTYKSVAEAFGLNYTPAEDII